MTTQGFLCVVAMVFKNVMTCVSFCVVAMAYKDCDDNGTWWRNPLTNMEWTFYGDCVKIEVSPRVKAV